MHRNGSARRIPVPDRAVPAGTDYASAFRVDPATGDAGTSQAGTAEQWARGVFESPPRIVRMLLRIGWRVLRLQLAPAADRGHVAGWTIATDAPTTFRLTARSPWLAASNQVEVAGGRVLWVTEVNYTAWPGRILWRAAAPIHHATMPIFLARADRLICAQ